MAAHVLSDYGQRPRGNQQQSTLRTTRSEGESTTANTNTSTAIGSNKSNSDGGRASNIPFQLKRIDHIVIRCREFQGMIDFYVNVLGCTIDHPDDVERFDGALTHLRAGDAYIDLLSYDPNHLNEAGQCAIIAMHNGGQGSDANSVQDIVFEASTSTMDHLCIRVDPFDEVAIMEHLSQHGVEIVSSGQRKGAEGTGPSIYVADPEGNVIELKGPSGPSPNSQSSSSSPIGVDSPSSPIHDSATGGMDQTTESRQDGTPGDETENTGSNNGQRQQASDDSISITPCNRICRYNANFLDGQVCIGCFRETYEISSWSGMSDEDRYYAVLDAKDRAVAGADMDLEGSVSLQDLERQAQFWKQRSMASKTG